jgi:hypothetical protein
VASVVRVSEGITNQPRTALHTAIANSV